MYIWIWTLGLTIVNFLFSPGCQQTSGSAPETKRTCTTWSGAAAIYPETFGWRLRRPVTTMVVLLTLTRLWLINTITIHDNKPVVTVIVGSLTAPWMGTAWLPMDNGKWSTGPALPTELHWWIFYKQSAPPPSAKDWRKIFKISIFLNRILTLILFLFSNFQQNPYIFCQFLLTMSSSIQFCIKIDVLTRPLA